VPVHILFSLSMLTKAEPKKEFVHNGPLLLYLHPKLNGIIVIVRKTGPDDDTQLLAAQSKADILTRLDELYHKLKNFYFSLVTEGTNEQCDEFLIQ
jgi:negative regulator of genetic competence, sporulation and motility